MTHPQPYSPDEAENTLAEGLHNLAESIHPAAAFAIRLESELARHSALPPRRSWQPFLRAAWQTAAVAIALVALLALLNGAMRFRAAAPATGETAAPSATASPPPSAPPVATAAPTATLLPGATPTPEVQPGPLPIVTKEDDWITYRNDPAGYQFRLPIEATLTLEDLRQIAPDAHPEALPEGVDLAQYLEQLAQTYGNHLCVDIAYRSGVIRIAARRDPGVDWVCIGLSNSSDLPANVKSEDILAAGQRFEATGWEATDATGALYEQMTLDISPELRIFYGSSTNDAAAYQDYLTHVRPVIVQIVSSIRPVPTVQVSNYYRSGESVGVRLCYEMLPWSDQWLPDRIRLWLDGRDERNDLSYEAGLVNMLAPANGQRGYRCDAVSFTIPETVNLDGARLEVLSFHADPNEGEYCQWLTEKVQPLLDGQNSGIQIQCSTEPHTLNAEITAKPQEMSDDEAQRIVSEAYQASITVSGPWEFTLPGVSALTPTPNETPVANGPANADATPVPDWNAYEAALSGHHWEGYGTRLCEWDVWGRGDQTEYIWAYCLPVNNNETDAASFPAVVTLDLNGRVVGIDSPIPGADYASELARLFPGKAQDTLAAYHFDEEAARQHILARLQDPSLPPLIAMQNSPQLQTPGVGVVAASEEWVNVRAGPAVEYDVIGVIAGGTQVMALGQSPDGSWVQIEYAPAADSLAWLWGAYITTSGGLPVVVSPPTPTPISAPPLPPQTLAGLIVGDTGFWRVGSDGVAVHITDQTLVAVSPDGRWGFNVVGNADGGPADIWITDLAADHLLRLTMTDQRAEDSPVGWLAHPEWVLFNSYPADAEQPMLAGRLTAIRTDGTGYAVLDGEHSSCYPPAPSPNGQQIAFGCDASLWLYDWKAGRAATLNPTEYGFENVEGQWFIHPAWSPDGAKVSWSWVSGWESGGVEQAGIIVFDLAAKTHQLLHLHTPMTPIPPGKLVWSADGRQVAFSAFATDVMREAVWLSNTDWGSEIRISNAEFTPATFSADGKWLVLQATNIGIYRAMPGIWLADTANGQLYQVSMPLVVNGSEVQVTYPSWLSWPSP